MQSYLKYKAYYDRKAKAAPLETTHYCYILNPKADTQATKIPFREFRWCGPYKLEKVLPNNNYIVQKLRTNKTQLLHRIRLRKFTPPAPLADIFLRGTAWQKDDQMPIANMIYTPNHGTQSLGLIRSKMVLRNIHKTQKMLNILRYLPDDTRPPSPGPSKNSGRVQWNRPLNQIKIMKTMQMKFHNTSLWMIKIPKKFKKNQNKNP